jgi:iron complex outermembrane receptor protein
MRRRIVTRWIAGNMCLQGCALALLCGWLPAFSAEAPARYAIHQPAQPLADTLRAIARQTGTSLIFDPRAVQGVTSAPVSGQYSAAEAVGRVLQGTGLGLTVQGEGVLVVRPAPARSSTAAPPLSVPVSRPSTDAVPRSVTLVALETTAAPAADAGPGNARDLEPQKVEVTGSRLRRIDSATAVPVNVYSRDEIEKSGQPSLGQFLAGLNEVSMGQGEGSFSVAAQSQGTVQLRGLPLGSTLVLVNGRRVQAVGNSSGNFFNLNLIPLAAVERVEVVPVGSSAVYGGDALAGVVNVILRKSLDGATFSARATSGRGFGDGGVSLGAGDRDERGGWLLLGSYSKVTPLLLSEREFFANVDYRRYGGPDARVRNCAPGTVSSNTSANLPGLNSTFAAIPADASGPLTIQSFVPTAGQANLCNGLSSNGATALFHGTESMGMHGSAWRVFGAGLDLFAELTFVKDKTQADGLGINFNNILVPASNPNNPFGVPVRVTARLGPENGREAYTRETNFLRALLGVRGEFGGGWDYEGTAVLSRDSGQRVVANNTVNTAARTSALATTDPALSLNPFTAGRVASDEVIRGIWSDTVRQTFGRRVMLGAFTRGPLFEGPAGAVDAIVGAESGEDDYESLQPDQRVISSRRTSAAYGELRAPLWKSEASGSGRGWALAALTLAARRDHYTGFGSADTYQAGLELRPTRNLLVRGSAATSFKPPSLVNIAIEQAVFPIEIAVVTDPARGNAPVVNGELVRMSNPDLKPEEGRAFALGALWEPAIGAGARFGLNAWRVRIDDLIGLLSLQTVINNEALFPGYVTREATVNGAPGRITRLMWAESNFGFVETHGFDLEASQSWQGPVGRWSVGAAATRTTKYSVVIAPGAPVSERLGRRFSEYWAPKWKGRLSIGLDEGAWSVGLTSRYLGTYLDTDPSTRSLGGSWVHDLSARLNLLRLGMNFGTAKAAALSLAVVNAGDRLPEFASGSPFFDTSQGDWRGRYASVRLSVSW